MKPFANRTCGRSILAALTLIMPAAGQVPDQLKHSIAGPPVGLARYGYLGHSVAVDGGYTVAGLPYEFTVGNSSGVVRVFDSGSGALRFELPNPRPDANDAFGSQVAISGSRVVVVVSQDDTNFAFGQVYVYDLASGTPTVPLITLNIPTPTPYDFFGVSVAIFGTWVVVGTPNDATSAEGSGSAYCYDLSSATPTVPVFRFHHPEAAEYASFGRSVAISGSRVVVGAPHDNSGALEAGSAYVYDLAGATPAVPVATLHNPLPAEEDNFGGAVAISGTRVAVLGQLDTTKGAFVYDLSSANPTVPSFTLNNPNPTSSDDAIPHVVIDGTRVVVGVADDGVAHVYDLSSTTPTTPKHSFENLAGSAAISGTRLVLGAPYDTTGGWGAGRVYLYNLSSGTPTVPVVTITNSGPPVGYTSDMVVAVSGPLMVVGNPHAGTAARDAGSAFVYDLTSATPSVPVATLNNPSPSEYAYFGDAVAISGTRVVVGARFDDTGAMDAGSAYVFDLSSGTPTVPVATLRNPSPSNDDHFGNSVAISGTRVVVGAPGDRFSAGSAFVYDLDRASPTVPVLTLNNFSSQVELFGTSVAIEGTRLVVGVPQDNTGNRAGGSTEVYDLSGPTPGVPVATLHYPNPAGYGNFGCSVAISGTRVVVGARFDDTAGDNAGSAYVFDLGSAAPTTPVATLINAPPAYREYFGTSVGISGTRVVVGAWRGYLGGSGYVGRADIYDLNSPTPAVPVASLDNPSPAGGDNFGWSVAIDGTTVAVAAPGDDTQALSNGTTYVFGPSPYSLWKISALGDEFAPDSGDGDHDGLGNLLEYGLLRSPTMAEGAPFTAASSLYGEGERLRLFVPRDPTRNDITLEVQASDDLSLGPWTTIATSTLGAPFSGPGYFGGDNKEQGVRLVEVRDTVNLPAAPRRFLRVRVKR